MTTAPTKTTKSTKPAKAGTAQSATKKPVQRKMYLIQLQDRKDTYLSLVESDVFAWIHGPYSPPAGQSGASAYEDEVPQSIRVAYLENNGKETCRVTRGSYDNDRAMTAESFGETFDSVVALTRYIKRHNIRIADEYHGLMY